MSLKKPNSRTAQLKTKQGKVWVNDPRVKNPKDGIPGRGYWRKRKPGEKGNVAFSGGIKASFFTDNRTNFQKNMDGYRQQEYQEVIPKLAKATTVKEIEDISRNVESFEIATVIDGKTGRPKSAGVGDLTSAPVGESEPGDIVTHNHPSWNYPPGDPRLKGRSLSHPDMMAAMQLDLGEIRALTPGATYRLKKGKNGWGDMGTADVIYGNHAKNVYFEWNKQIKDGKLDPRKAEVEFQGEIMRRTAKDMGWEYIEEKRTITAKDKDKARKAVERNGSNDYFETLGMKSTAINTTNNYVGMSKRKDAVDSIDARLIVQLANIVKKWIQRGYKGQIDFTRFSVPDAFKIEGDFEAFDKRRYNFNIDLKGTGKISYKFDKKKTPVRFHVLRLDSYRYDSKKRDKPRCSKGTPCGDSCQAQGNVCQLELSKYSSASERLNAARMTGQIDRRVQLGVSSTGKQKVTESKPKSKYQDMSIRELQREAREQGVTNYNNRRKEDLQKTLESLDASPQQRELMRETLNKRNREKQYAMRAIPGFYRKQWKDFDRTMKVIAQTGGFGGRFAAVAMTSYLMSTTVAGYNKLKDEYRGNLDESAQLAFKQAKKVKTQSSWKPNTTFAIGGGKAAGFGAGKIKEMLINDSDKSTAGQWFKQAHSIATLDYDSVDFKFDTPKYIPGTKLPNPARLGEHLSKTAQKYTENFRRKRNMDSVDLAARLYAQGLKNPDKGLNVLAFGMGGNVSDEAMEILAKMPANRRGGLSGASIAKKVNLVRIGTPFFGMMDGKIWKELSHKTLSNTAPGSSIIPKRAAKWFNKVKGSEIADYLEDGQVKQEVRESFNFFGDGNDSNIPVWMRRAYAESKGVGDMIPGGKFFFNNIDKITSKAQENPTQAAILTGVFAASVGAATYKYGQSQYTRALVTGAKEASVLTSEIPDPSLNKNVTVAVGGTGYAAKDLVDAMPDEYKNRTDFINIEDGNYGVEANTSFTTMSPITRMKEEMGGIGKATRRMLGLVGPNTTGSGSDPEAVRLAATLYKQAQAQRNEHGKDYTLNVMAMGDGGVKTRTALEMVARMPGGKAIADKINVVTYNSPDIGLSNSDPTKGYVPTETSFTGMDNVSDMLPKRGLNIKVASNDNSISGWVNDPITRQRFEERLFRESGRAMDTEEGAKEVRARYRDSIKDSAKQASAIADKTPTANKSRRLNVTYAVGGTGYPAETMAKSLENKYGSKSTVVNTEDGTFGIDANSALSDVTPEEKARLQREGERRATEEVPDQKAINLAASLYKEGMAQKDRGKISYALNIMAAGDGGITARKAIEILAQMEGGKEIADNVNLFTFNSPDVGINSTSSKEGYVHPNEISFTGQGNSAENRRKRGFQLKVPGVNDSVEDWVNSNVAESSFAENAYMKITGNPSRDSTSRIREEAKVAIKEVYTTDISTADLNEILSEIGDFRGKDGKPFDPNNLSHIKDIVALYLEKKGNKAPTKKTPRKTARRTSKPKPEEKKDSMDSNKRVRFIATYRKHYKRDPDFNSPVIAHQFERFN